MPSVAFQANGVEWASQLTAFGEVFTLPVVVLISLVIQPRLQYALGESLQLVCCEMDGRQPSSSLPLLKTSTRRPPTSHVR